MSWDSSMSEKDKAAKMNEKNWPDQQRLEKSGVMEFKCFKKRNMTTHMKCY